MLSTMWENFWTQDLQREMVHAGQDVWTVLDIQYSEGHRHYHTGAHIFECITQVLRPEVQAMCDNPHAVQMALWKHDIIYNVHVSDNERQSANLMRSLLKLDGFSEEFLSLTDSLIMITCHDGVPQSIDEKIVVDIDLSVLGGSPARYNRYVKDIRQEYSFVPDNIFYSRRLEVMQGIAAGQVFHTPLFAPQEEQAQANIEREIAGIISSGISL